MKSAVLKLKVYVLTLALCSLAPLAHAEDPATDFLAKIFPAKNQGAVVKGGGQVILNAGQVFANIKKEIAPSQDSICAKDGDDRAGWYEYGSKAIQGFHDELGSVHLYHYINCEEADLYPTIAILKTGKGKNWILMPVSMQSIDFIGTYGMQHKYEERIIMVGSNWYPGGGVSVPRVTYFMIEEDEITEISSQ